MQGILIFINCLHVRIDWVISIIVSKSKITANSLPMKQRVYFDSTIISFYCDNRVELSPWIDATVQWWESHKEHYECWISEAVVQELDSGENPNREKVMTIASTVPLLDPSPEIESITEFYVSNFLMPKNLLGDALHLAYASFYNFDYLLTWNCKHLANANKKKHIRILNARLGLGVPEITTPLELNP